MPGQTTGGRANARRRLFLPRSRCSPSGATAGDAARFARRPLILDELAAIHVVRVQKLVAFVPAGSVGEKVGVDLLHRRVLVRLAHAQRCPSA